MMAVVPGTVLSMVEHRDRHHSVASKQAADPAAGQKEPMTAR
ncbi:MAG TPA: hypothetical protein VF395_07780 [Polyangiaceae bacterium]